MLDTSRLLLRPPQASDAEAFFSFTRMGFPALLNPSDLGSYQTGSAGLALQKFVAAAYKAIQKT